MVDLLSLIEKLKRRVECASNKTTNENVNIDKDRRIFLSS